MVGKKVRFVEWERVRFKRKTTMILTSPTNQSSEPEFRLIAGTKNKSVNRFIILALTQVNPHPSSNHPCLLHSSGQRKKMSLFFKLFESELPLSKKNQLVWKIEGKKHPAFYFVEGENKNRQLSLHSNDLGAMGFSAPQCGHGWRRFYASTNRLFD